MLLPIGPSDHAWLKAVLDDPETFPQSPDEVTIGGPPAQRSIQFDLNMARRRADMAEKIMRNMHDSYQAERRRRMEAERVLMLLSVFAVVGIYFISYCVANAIMKGLT